MREFVSRPPSGNVRLYCTMIRHDEDSNLSAGTCYTLYLEYLGGLVPLLKGKRTSKIRPEFVIFDPQLEGIIFFKFFFHGQ
jgi:tubby-related protein 4